MKGKHEIIVKNNRLQYKFTIERNITIIRGNSATGKTTLIEMIREYSELGKDSGIELSCDKNCVTLEGRGWQNDLKIITDSIVFIDEGNPFITSTDFARTVQDSDNYYVIATRGNLAGLPYSVDEIYSLKNSTSATSKYRNIKRYYTGFKKLYGEKILRSTVVPDYVIAEDSNSGYEFFKAICDKYNIPCVSAKGKSNVYKTALEAEGKAILIIADGVAFGSEIEKVLSLQKKKPIYVFLPESFEYLILNSNLINDTSVNAILDNTAEYVESQKYLSWEQFFTKLLLEKTVGTYLQYQKSKLNPVYLHENAQKAILANADVIDWTEQADS